MVVSSVNAINKFQNKQENGITKINTATSCTAGQHDAAYD